MAQFDVHANKGKQRDAIPFVVVVQSSFFDAYHRRVVVPLARTTVTSGKRSATGARLNPIFRIRNTDVTLHPLQVVSVAFEELGPKVSSLAEHGQAITDALDEVFSRSWG
ncbi:CcdB family protein [Ramlibacter albus]|uniref:Toxin CcdB n=1 Tax=Ramlibacter albus TaxID=2079448 RepID=A0A923M9E1_9BURK|nr:CcdB family protein [Ramlibacter albus]